MRSASILEINYIVGVIRIRGIFRMFFGRVFVLNLVLVFQKNKGGGPRNPTPWGRTTPLIWILRNDKKEETDCSFVTLGYR